MSRGRDPGPDEDDRIVRIDPRRLRRPVEDGAVPASPRFAEMVAATNYSFLRGASSPADMVARALQLGHVGIGIAGGIKVLRQLVIHFDFFLNRLQILNLNPKEWFFHAMFQ